VFLAVEQIFRLRHYVLPFRYFARL
jgi:hypothetical protein